MIFGNGDLGKALTDRDGALFFVSGVSNSQETDTSKFARESNMIRSSYIHEKAKTRCLFYFSSLSIYFKDSLYTRHKIGMEKIIRNTFKNYCIIRIGNIDFGNNPHTFINYFRACIEKGLPYKVFDEYRYLISKEELLLLTNNLPLTGKNEISVTGRIVKVQTIVDELIQEHERKLQARQ